ncbi:MAG: metallophosphoesterase [Planctomycetota bacterium]
MSPRTASVLRALLSILLLLAPVATVRAQSGAYADDSEFEALWTPLEGTRPAQWRVLWKGDASTTATVSWTTLERGEQHFVVVSPIGTDRDGNRLAPGTALGGVAAWRVEATRTVPCSPGRGEGDAPLVWFHHADLTGLSPATRYAFRLVSDGSTSRDLWFETAPASGTDFTLLYGGDSRSGWRDRCRVNLMMATMAERLPHAIGLVHGGDYVYDGSQGGQWIRWLSHHELATAADGRVLPIVAARGNHDFGPCFGEVFDFETGDRGVYYRADVGSDVAILTLDTNASTLGDQLGWMRSEFAAARASARWVLANYHRPMFPAVKTPAECAPYWVPVFEENDVDLVLESDGHCMKRTVPIRDGRNDPTGVVYVGEGGMGVPQRRPDGERWYFRDGGFVASGHHVMLVELSQETLRTRFCELVDPLASAEITETLVGADANWRYVADRDPASDWTSVGFDDSTWGEGRAPLGYGDDDTVTELPEMRHHSQRAYLRTRFEVAEDVTRGLAISIDYDDAFVAYVDGIEVARRGVTGRGSEAVDVWDHEAGLRETILLERPTLPAGAHVLAVEGHNVSIRSSDFRLDPRLVVLDLGGDEAPPWTVVDDHTLHVRERAAASR